MPQTPTLDDANPKKRLEAADVLAKAGDFRGLPEILACLGDANREVRLRAAGLCAAIGPPAALGPLETMLRSDPHTENRNGAIWAMEGIGTPDVMRPLIGALKDANVERRTDARAALYGVFGPGLLRLLADEDGGPDPDPDETRRVEAWWAAHAGRFDPEVVYSVGEPAGPGAFIDRMKRARVPPIPDGILLKLNQWTGVEFGVTPFRKVVKRWEAWWTAQRDHYEVGRRYYWGQRVP